MKKILFILSSDLFVRNYIRTGVIDSLNKEYDCKIVASRNIFNKDEVEKLKNFAGYYISDPKAEKRSYFIMNVTLWRYRKKSTTFIFRFMRKSRLRDFNIFSSWSQFKAFLAFVKREIKRNSLLFHIILGNLFIYPFFIFIYKKIIPHNKYLEELIQSIKPDLILFPSSAFDPIGNDIIEIGIKKKLKTVFLIDNWDNLSSKTVLRKKPNFITVWGRQSLEHAIKIHGFKEKQIFMIGTPRFEIYYKNLNNLPKSPINGKYVLFTGVALKMDETGALRELEEELEQNRGNYGDLKIIYRPHPWRLGRNDFFESDFKHVELDMQMRDHYLWKQQNDLKNKVTTSVNFQPDIDYYPAILGNALFVVSPLTTMSLEALIIEKKVLLIVYDDGKNLTSPNNVFNYYEHFRGIEKLKGFSFCKEKSRLKQQFRKIYLSMKRDGFKPIKSDLSYFLFNDIRRYEQRLYDVIEDIINLK